MSRSNPFHSVGIRLIASYAALFAGSVAVLGVIVFLTVHAALADQLDARIESEVTELVEQHSTGGRELLLRLVRQRTLSPGQLDYGVESPTGRLVAGELTALRAPPGWSWVEHLEPGDEPERTRILVARLPDGYRIVVGDDTGRIAEIDAAILQSFGWTLLAVLVLGGGGGFLLRRNVVGRIDTISSTAEAIIDGDLTRRVPCGGSGDDLDRLAATLNLMLDRIGALLESLRQVSSDVAHDLRTPLTRLRQRLETALVDPDPAARETAVERAIDESDALLQTFAGLLRIAQIEGGARRAAFSRTDLAAAAITVAEAFAPSAEDAGQTLVIDAPRAVQIDGDPELMVQLIVNLVENALRHAGPNATVRVRAAMGADGPILSVTDNGAGIPTVEHERVFDRFYRLERSRTTSGSGLGLALVRAISRLHRAEITLRDAAPGLVVELRFPPVSVD